MSASGKTNGGTHAKLGWKSFYKKYGILVILLLVIVVSYIIEPKFLSSKNITNVLRQVSVNGILALGMTFVIISGAIDLSAGNMVGFAAVISILLQQKNMPLYIVIPIVYIAVMLTSSFVGYCISHGMPAFIMTLAAGQTILGVNYILTGGMPQGATSEVYKWFGQGFVIGIPVPILIYILLIVAAYLILNRTKIGRSIYVLGGNRAAARLSGININKIRVIVYMIMGFFIASSAIVVSSRVYSAEPLTGDGYQLDAIAATIIGGTKMSGGEGSVLRTVVGSFIIGIISNILNIAGASPYAQMIFKGLIIFIAVAADTWKKVDV